MSEITESDKRELIAQDLERLADVVRDTDVAYSYESQELYEEGIETLKLKIERGGVDDE